MHWCRHRVKFNEVPEKVPKVPEKVWDLVQRQVRFNRVPEIQSQEIGCRRSGRSVQPEKVPEKVPGGFGAEPGQVQQGSGEGSGEALGKPWCKAKSGSTGPGEGCREGPGEGFGGIFGAGPGQVPTGSKGFQRLVSQHVSERFVKIKRCGCWGYHRKAYFLYSCLPAFFSRICTV